MDINLGLSERDMRLARRRELPTQIRNMVADGAVRIELTFDAESALNLAADLEYAVENHQIAKRAVLPRP